MYRTLIYLFFTVSCAAQSSFQILKTTDLVMCGAVIPLNIGGRIIYENKKPLNAEYIQALNVNSINWFDRIATKRYSEKSSKVSDILLTTFIASPAFLLIDKKLRSDLTTKGIIYFETIGITAAEIRFVKGLVDRARPYVYNKDVPLEKKIKPDANSSFFSGHTALSSAACFYAAGIIAAEYPNKNKWIWYTAALAPLSAGYFRYAAGKHFFTDILTGLAVGALNGFVLTRVHRVE